MPSLSVHFIILRRESKFCSRCFPDLWYTSCLPKSDSQITPIVEYSRSLTGCISRMTNKSLIKVNSLLSASEEVVTSLMTGLIEMVVDKMAVDKVVLDKMAVDKVAVDKVAVDKAAIKSGSEKKVVRKANIVQRKSLELKFREKDEIVSREKLEKVKSSSRSKSFTPMWVEEPKLPSGWKSCVAGDIDRAVGFGLLHGCEKVGNHQSVYSLQPLGRLHFTIPPVASYSQTGLR